tara:strand:- start:720 stop:1448 length:729 start_codon:yes stop_codon:yes gene_type:complete
MVTCGQRVSLARGLLRTLRYNLDALDEIKELLIEAEELLQEAPTQKREKARTRQQKSRAKRKTAAASRVTGCDASVTGCDSEVVEGGVGVGVGVEAGDALAWAENANRVLTAWGGVTGHNFQLRDTKDRRHVIAIIKALHDENPDVGWCRAEIGRVVNAKWREWRHDPKMAHLVRPETIRRHLDTYRAALSVVPDRDDDPHRYTGPTDAEKDAARRTIKACPACMAMSSGACGKHIQEGIVA